MGYPATVFKVMIACPGDLDERVVRDAVREWNDEFSESRGVVFLPVSWRSHGAPGTGNRPQEIINKEVLADCDLLIALFWGRLGTPTGHSLSGTVEELQGHIASGKPAMVFFSTQPIDPAEIDPDQLRALREFSEELQKKSLLGEFESEQDLREKLRRALSHRIERDLKPHASAPSLERGTPPQTQNLSLCARGLLVAASESPAGELTVFTDRGDLHVQTAGTELVPHQSARTKALYAAGIKELVESGLLEDRSGSGAHFNVTAAGFQAFEHLPSVI